MPPSLAARPELPAWCAFAWECFDDLSGDRQLGMGVGPISWRSIAEWARCNHIVDVELLVTWVRALDSDWLEHQGKDADANGQS